jgi:hypothetical protein
LNARAAIAVAALVCAAPARPAWSTDWVVSADLRLVDSDAETSLFDGGFGALRYDSDHDGFQVGRLRAALMQPLGDVFDIKLDASYWGQDAAHPFALTEGYLEYRPYPIDGWKARVRLGADYPPVSLEDTSAGWSSPYTISNSALNAWIGEEIRTVGLDAQLEWLGTRMGHDFDLAVSGGVFGWNEPAGVVVATGGFSINDFQTPLGGYIGGRNSAVFSENPLFRQYDNRAGFYLSAEAHYLDRATLLFTHYDNRADPSAGIEGTYEYGWHTRFDAAGLRLDSGTGWSAIVQWLDGQTDTAPDDDFYSWPFRAKFALLSWQRGRQTVSARYDVFSVESNADYNFGAEDGHAWTVAYIFDQSSHWRFALEWVHVTSNAVNRYLELDEPQYARENQAQISVRYTIGSDRLY